MSTLLHSFEHHWPTVQPVVKKLIYNKPISKPEWQEIFYHVHMICLWDEEGCPKLLKELELEFMGSLIGEIRDRLLSIEDGQQQLKEYIDCWTDFSRHCHWFPAAFQQLDLAARRKDSIVRALMLKLWNRNVVIPLNQRLQASAMELILAERNGHIVDSQTINGLRESFMYLDSPQSNYLQSFETTYVQEIEIFYSSKAHEQMREFGVIEYIRWALQKFENEERRTMLYLESSQTAMQRVIEACTRVLVAIFVEQVLDECSQYIRANDSDNMRLIFRFLDKVKGSSEKFLEQLCNHISATGLSYLMAPSSANAGTNCNCEDYVEKLVQLYHQFEKIIKFSFNNDLRAKSILDKAFEIVVNDKKVFQTNYQNDQSVSTPVIMVGQQCIKTTVHRDVESRSSELLANYCDLLLRRTSLSRKFTTEDIIERLNEILTIIKFVRNKDAFIKHHKLHLARRLILNTTLSIEREEQFVGNLKDLAAMPQEQISKLLRMFKDLKASEDMQQEYIKNFLPMFMEGVNSDNNNTIQSLASQLATNLTVQDNNNRVPIKDSNFVSFKVLNPRAWSRTTDEFPISLPDEITSLLPRLEVFYGDQYPGRKLDWCHQLSTGTIALATDKGKYDLDITAAQLSILSVFKDEPRATKALKELKRLTKLSSPDLRRALWSLVSNPKLKVQLMNCEPQLSNIKDLEKGDNTFSINHDFTVFKNGAPQPKGRVSLIGRLQV